MNNFIIRFFSSIVFGSFFLTLIFLNAIYFKLLLLIILILGFFEIFRIRNIYIRLFIFILFIIFLISFYSLRSMTNGLFLVIWCLFITWTTDSSAYFFGKLFGKKKIKFISPNKTYFGFFSGILFSQTSYILTTVFAESINNFYFFKIVFIQFLVSIIVITGDLFFSFIKRRLDIKDYSNLIPGHGGIFDRIDGLIFSIILFNLFFSL